MQKEWHQATKPFDNSERVSLQKRGLDSSPPSIKVSPAKHKNITRQA
jgi:hypothetical protein